MRKKLADMPVNTFASCKAWRRNSFDWSYWNVELMPALLAPTGEAYERIMRYFKEHPGTRLALFSDTLTGRSLREFTLQGMPRNQKVFA